MDTMVYVWELVSKEFFHCPQSKDPIYLIVLPEEIKNRVLKINVCIFYLYMIFLNRSLSNSSHKVQMAIILDSIIRLSYFTP